MKSMYHVLLLSILTFFCIQALGLVSPLGGDDDRYDHARIIENTKNYIYDANSILIGTSEQQPSKFLSEYSSNNLALAFVDVFLATKKGLGGNPFQGKTPQQIDKMFLDKGFDVKGTDPVAGKGSYINPNTGRKYYIDKGGKYKKGTELPHVDVHRPSNSFLPKKKLPLGDRLIE